MEETPLYLRLCLWETALCRLWPAFQTSFPIECPSFTSHQQQKAAPAQPPCPPGWFRPLYRRHPSSRAREGKKWFHQLCQHGDPRLSPQEPVLTSPVPRTEPAEKKKRQQAKKKIKIKSSLLEKKTTQTQIKIIFGTYITLLKFFKHFINTS